MCPPGVPPDWGCYTEVKQIHIRTHITYTSTRLSITIKAHGTHNSLKCTLLRRSVVGKTWGEKGIKGFYPGGSAIAMRQATNWASRQGFTEFFRSKMAVLRHDDPKVRGNNRHTVRVGSPAIRISRSELS